MTIKNLTPHVITVLLDDGTKKVFPSDGVARAAVTTTVVGNIDGIDIVSTVFGDPVDLPDPTPDTRFIVSLATANAARAAGRTTDDLLVTANPVRNDDGVIIGCRNLGTI